jgi:hypothetical protein
LHSRGKLTVEVRRAKLRDLDTVLDLYRTSFAPVSDRPVDELRRKLRQLFFDGPLVADDLPSLVAVDEGGEVVGFRGWLARRWRLGDELLPGRCGTHHMVRHDLQRRGVGFAITEASWEIRDRHSPDKIAFSDRVSDDGRAFADATRRETGQLHRLEQLGFCWKLPLRRLAVRESRAVGRRLGLSEALTARIASAVAACRPRRPIPDTGMPPLRGAPLSGQALAEVHAALGADFPLHLDESVETWSWLCDYLADYGSRGRYEGRVWLEETGEPLGFYVAYLKPDGIFEVAAFAVRHACYERALEQLIRDADALGARGLWGWASARELRPLIARGAIIHQGRRASVTTSRRDVRLAFESMEALFSGLEGERWL